MKTITKALRKGAIGTVAAGAMAMASATPATAQYRDRDDGGISAGEIIAGAVILGGIAAVAGSIGNRDGYRGYDRRYGNTYGYGYTTPRAAVEQCVAAATREARRYGYRDARVTQIRDVDDKRDGWKVKGNVVVNGNRGYYNNRYNDRYRDYRYNNNRYDNYRYNNSRYDRGYDQGRFSCDIRRGRVTDIDFSGIRGLR